MDFDDAGIKAEQQRMDGWMDGCVYLNKEYIRSLAFVGLGPKAVKSLITNSMHK